MPFKELLRYLVESVPGADGAVFADWEGEVVDLFTAQEDSDHVRFIAAHHGILLEAVKRASESARLGETQYVIISSEKADYITAPVHDGYYIVLAVQAGLPLARARMAMEDAIRALKQEMGY